MTSNSSSCGYVGNLESAESYPHIHQPKFRHCLSYTLLQKKFCIITEVGIITVGHKNSWEIITMTIIVGVIKENEISIAGDTLSNRGSTKVSHEHIVDHEKIYKVGDSYLGLAGWQALFNIIEHLIEVEPSIFRFDSRHNIFETILNLQNIFKEKYFIKTNENDNQPVESNHLSGIIINKNGLFEIDSYREVRQYNKFWAIGSGSKFALGALNALYEKEFKAEELAIEGVKAAAEFDDGCSLPHTSYTIKI